MGQWRIQKESLLRSQQAQQFDYPLVFESKRIAMKEFKLPSKLEDLESADSEFLTVSSVVDLESCDADECSAMLSSRL